MWYSFTKCVIKVVVKLHTAAKLVMVELLILKGAEFTRSMLTSDDFKRCIG